MYVKGCCCVTGCVGFFHVPGNAGIGLRSETEEVWHNISSGFLSFVAPGLCLASRDCMLARTLAVQKPAGFYHINLLR